MSTYYFIKNHKSIINHGYILRLKDRIVQVQT